MNILFRHIFFLFLASILCSCGGGGGTNESLGAVNNTINYSDNSNPLSTTTLTNRDEKVLSGVAQKGPALEGSLVTLYELDIQARRTGRVLHTSTQGSWGGFALSLPDDIGRFIEVVFNGRFLDEFTGELSTPVQLRAIHDLSRTNQVSVNLLTTLAAARATAQSNGTDNYSLYAALRAAYQSLAKLTGIPEQEIAQLSLFGSGEKSSRAAMVLLSGSLLEIAHSEQTTVQRVVDQLSIDFALDGVFDERGDRWLRSVQELIQGGERDFLDRYVLSLRQATFIEDQLPGSDDLAEIVVFALRPTAMAAVKEVSVCAGDDVILTGSESKDSSNGNNLHYTWFQTDHTAFPVPLSDRFTVETSFTAPDVMNSVNLFFTLIVVDEQSDLQGNRLDIADSASVKVIILSAKDSSCTDDMEVSSEEPTSPSEPVEPPVSDPAEPSNPDPIEQPPVPIAPVITLPPVADDTSKVVTEGGSIDIDLNQLVTNPLGQGLIYSIHARPVNGIASVDTNGVISYTHNGGETVEDAIGYQITEQVETGEIARTANAVVFLSVTPVNDNPTAVNDSASVKTGDQVSINVLGNDSDPETGKEDLTIRITEQAIRGHAVVQQRSVVLYTPDEDACVGIEEDVCTDQFSYLLSDGNGGTDTATVEVTITVQPNLSPRLSVSNIQAGSNGTIQADSRNNVVSSITATDPENDSLIFSLSGNDAAGFSLANVAGAPETRRLVFNSIPIAGTYVLTVTVLDEAGNTQSQDLRIVVPATIPVIPVTPPSLEPENPNTAPLITTSNNVSFLENGSGLVLDVQSIDDSDSEASGLVFSIIGGGDRTKFNLDNVGRLTFREPPDFENPLDSDTNNIYEIQIKVVDSENLEARQLIRVTVTDVAENTAPQITSTNSINFIENGTGDIIDIESLDDINAEGEGIIYSISGGADQAFFGIDSGTGQLTFNASPDFENPLDQNEDNIYQVQITVTDNGGLSSSQIFLVTIIDVAENTAPEIISSSAVSFPENGNGVVLDIQGIDDTDSEGAGLVFSLSGGDDQAFFGIDSGTGQLTFNASPDFENPLDQNGDNVYRVQVAVTDNSGLSSSQVILVTIIDVVENTAPEIISSSDVSFPENGNGVVLDIQGIDDTDSEGAGLVFSLSGGDDQAFFGIDSGTGQLTFNASPDFENPGDSNGDNLYRVEVTLTDNDALFVSQIINVTVTDVVEGTPDSTVNTPPVAKDDAFQATSFLLENVLLDNGNGKDSDADNDTLSVTLVSDAQHGDLSLNSDGSFSYEVLDFFGTDSFIYQISDGNGGTDTATVTITVIDLGSDI